MHHIVTIIKNKKTTILHGGRVTLYPSTLTLSTLLHEPIWFMTLLYSQDPIFQGAFCLHPIVIWYICFCVLNNNNHFISSTFNGSHLHRQTRAMYIYNVVTISVPMCIISYHQVSYWAHQIIWPFERDISICHTCFKIGYQYAGLKNEIVRCILMLQF